MGDGITEDTLLDLVLEGLPDEYTHILYSAEADNDVSLNYVGIAVRDILSNRFLRN